MPSSYELGKKYFFNLSWVRSYARLWDLVSALREPQSVKEVSSRTLVTEVMWGQNQHLRPLARLWWSRGEPSCEASVFSVCVPCHSCVPQFPCV